MKKIFLVVLASVLTGCVVTSAAEHQFSEKNVIIEEIEGGDEDGFGVVSFSPPEELDPLCLQKTSPVALGRLERPSTPRPQSSVLSHQSLAQVPLTPSPSALRLDLPPLPPHPPQHSVSLRVKNRWTSHAQSEHGSLAQMPTSPTSYASMSNPPNSPRQHPPALPIGAAQPLGCFAMLLIKCSSCCCKTSQ